MIVITNTIRVEKKYTENLVKQFRGQNDGENSLRHIATVEGFLGLEVWTIQREEHDEVVVVSKWENKEAQQAWVKSDLFKKVHGRTKDTREQKRDRPGILGNKVSQYEIAHTQESSVTLT